MRKGSLVSEQPNPCGVSGNFALICASLRSRMGRRARPPSLSGRGSSMSRPRRPCSKTASTCTFFGLLCSTVGRSACGTSTNWGMHLDIGSDSSVAQVSRPAPRCTIPPCSATAAQQVDRCNQVGQWRRPPQWPNVCSGPMCAVRHATHAPVPRSLLRRRLGRLRAWPPAKPPAACPLAPLCAAGCFA